MKSRWFWWGTLGLLGAVVAVDHHSTRRQIEDLRRKYGAMAGAETSRADDRGDAVRAQLALLTGAAHAALVAPAPTVVSLPAANPPPRADRASSSNGGEPPSYSEHAAHIDAVLAQEPQDPSWSQDAEGKIDGALASLAVGGARIGKVSCRSTLCRLRVENTTDDSLHEVVNQIFATRDTNGYWKGDMFTARDPKSPPGTFANVIYFAREAHPIPFIEN